MKFCISRVIQRLHYVVRFYSGDHSPTGLEKIRNIGIIAHIDAGKTTTTESMLYHAGKIRRMGKVDSGNTVTDYLPSERARGITVQSAAVSFGWKDYIINLVDTPGHVDFTIEVERALHVLDGTVAILDGSRGVEAQTRKVWRQADKLKVPKIAFINKMDKPGADFVAAVKSMQTSLSANTFVVQYPIMKDGVFNGIINVVDMNILKWNSYETSDCVEVCDLKHIEDSEIIDQCLHLRQKLIEQLADIDDKIAELYLGTYIEDVFRFPAKILKDSLQNAVICNAAIPVLCGSAVKDLGVTPLLDSVIDYLPSPEHSSLILPNEDDGKLVGYAFKVVHHKRFGPVVFVRIVSGTLTTGTKIYNASVCKSEQVSQLFTVFADEYKPIPQASQGHIAAVTGLRLTGTGDTIHSCENSASRVLAPVIVPPPVFFCTVEANSPTEVKALEAALSIVTREDPSIQVQLDSSSGQTILSGMGELHMDILIERLKNEFKLKCYIGPIQVAYREKLNAKLKKQLHYERKLLEKTYSIKMTMSILPRDDMKKTKIKILGLGNSPESKAIEDGIMQACSSGPLMGFPLICMDVKVHDFHTSSNCPQPIITAAVVNMTNEILCEADCSILEPMMDIQVLTNEEKLPQVLNSLSQKHAKITSIEGEIDEKYVHARAPVSEMLGFASLVRKLTSGNADLTLNVSGYEEVADENIKALRDRLIGL